MTSIDQCLTQDYRVSIRFLDQHVLPEGIRAPIIERTGADLKAGTVAVYRSVRVKGDTKTRNSRRVLKLPTKAVLRVTLAHGNHNSIGSRVGSRRRELKTPLTSRDGGI